MQIFFNISGSSKVKTESVNPPPTSPQKREPPPLTLNQVEINSPFYQPKQKRSFNSIKVVNKIIQIVSLLILG